MAFMKMDAAKQLRFCCFAVFFLVCCKYGLTVILTKDSLYYYELAARKTHKVISGGIRWIKKE